MRQPVLRFKSREPSTKLIRVTNRSRTNNLDRRVSVAPMMDWSDEVNSEKNLNHLGHRQKSCPHFVTTIRYSQRHATELPHTSACRRHAILCKCATNAKQDALQYRARVWRAFVPLGPACQRRAKSVDWTLAPRYQAAADHCARTSARKLAQLRRVFSDTPRVGSDIAQAHAGYRSDIDTAAIRARSHTDDHVVLETEIQVVSVASMRPSAGTTAVTTATMCHPIARAACSARSNACAGACATGECGCVDGTSVRHAVVNLDQAIHGTVEIVRR